MLGVDTRDINIWVPNKARALLDTIFENRAIPMINLSRVQKEGEYTLVARYFVTIPVALELLR